jgi:hypothetical protein
MAGRLVALPNNTLTSTPLISQRCAALAHSGESSSFVVAGRYGLPPEPGGWLASPLVLDGTVSGLAAQHERPSYGKDGTDSLSEPGMPSIRRSPVAHAAGRIALSNWIEGCGS